ncbi:CheR family methyltransferase [Halomonas binhaiensis]|uniref:CheR family methyltransferase n=1 Tax=Halomonas binhaiensis TaxID=2562282 RepID=UPI0030844C80
MNRLSSLHQSSGSSVSSDARASLGRDLILTADDFNRIRALIYQHAGIVLAEHKQEMVYGRLAKRLRQLGIRHFGDYLSRLDGHPDNSEWEIFINALTTNLTAFFRESHHFPLLAKHARQCQGRMRVWCAASSTGEEPYSIAMTLNDALGPSSLAQQRFEVIATDIDTEALAKARAGIYPWERLAQLDDDLVHRYFLRGKGSRQGQVRIHPDLASHLSFSSLNLLSSHWDLTGPFDAIFCRNVLIYFDEATQQRILGRFIPLLKPNGLLFLGHSEHIAAQSTVLLRCGQTVYGLPPGSKRKTHGLTTEVKKTSGSPKES